MRRSALVGQDGQISSYAFFSLVCYSKSSYFVRRRHSPFCHRWLLSATLCALLRPTHQLLTLVTVPQASGQLLLSVKALWP